MESAEGPFLGTGKAASGGSALTVIPEALLADRECADRIYAETQGLMNVTIRDYLAILDWRQD